VQVQPSDRSGPEQFNSEVSWAAVLSLQRLALRGRGLGKAGWSLEPKLCGVGDVVAATPECRPTRTAQ
jgi:hypothetical protein